MSTSLILQVKFNGISSLISFLFFSSVLTPKKFFFNEDDPGFCWN
jgi:hypothetical protein